ncbi:MAG: autoinducer binding domain-containing protein [Pseudomonadota bacterium]
MSSTGIELKRYELGLLAPAGYYVGLHIRFTSPMIFLDNYPVAWTDHYTSQAYALRDPIVAWGFSTTGVTRWSEIDLPDPFNIMGQAKDYGLIYGVSVSVGELTSRTIGSVSRQDREYTEQEMVQIQEIIHSLHITTEPPDSLTDAQIEALRLIASGMRYAEAAQKLGISGSALKARLTAARNKLLARTTAEAIQRAKEYRLL